MGTDATHRRDTCLDHHNGWPEPPAPNEAGVPSVGNAFSVGAPRPNERTDGGPPIAPWTKKPTKKLMKITNKIQLTMFVSRFGW